MSYVIVKNVGGFGILCEVREEKRGNRVVQVHERLVAKLGKIDSDKDPQQGIAIPITGDTTDRKKVCWNKLRSDIYIRDNAICWICNKFVPLNEYELGHLVDRCKGGQDSYDNLAVMHKKCNNEKPQHCTMDEHILWLLKTRFLMNKTIPKEQGLLVPTC